MSSAFGLWITGTIHLPVFYSSNSPDRAIFNIVETILQ